MPDRMDTNALCDRLMNPPVSSGWCDSDRNIMAGLRHEACEGHCCDCGKCIDYGETVHYLPTEGDDEYCDDCSLWYYEQKHNPTVREGVVKGYDPNTGKHDVFESNYVMECTCGRTTQYACTERATAERWAQEHAASAARMSQTKGMTPS